MGWPLGAVITQACHAATAAIHLHYSDSDTQEYLADLDNMHKVVLQIEDQGSLVSLARDLKDRGIAFKLWYEQPGDIPTCVALKPYCKEMVRPLMRDFKLFQ